MSQFVMNEKNKLHEVACQVVSLASQLKKIIVTAESCTGGLVATSITDIPGSSCCFSHGVVTYSDAAKNTILGIDSVLIKDNGAVSKAVAECMAKKVLRGNAADISVAITGIAGPTGGSLEKPVGTVWLAWGYYVNNQIIVDTQDYCFNGDRNTIRFQSAIEALLGLEKRMKK
jgi:nicotinamide-nucleotide amidase|tara:strand:+ start:620 stop:1138 length:519 start_codon:yes stop_codon:yes gene_type:complete